jgi:hypothetical protein
VSARHGIISGRHFKALVILLFVLAISGCGKSGAPTATVSGTVTYRGAPVTAGTVSFFGPDNRVATTSINPDGTYTATNVPVGEVTVAVNTPRPVTELKKAAKQNKKRFGVGVPYPETVDRISIPVDYSNPAKSGLGLTVVKGSQPYDIVLK